MSSRVGIISPYRHHVQYLRSAFKEINVNIPIDTVEGYQGREREFIIFSCVRAPNPQKRTKSVGFLADVRRMNVALTRPRSTLLIVGNSKSLRINPDWRALVQHSIESKCCIHFNYMFCYYFVVSLIENRCKGPQEDGHFCS
jgi:senataxin